MKQGALGNGGLKVSAIQSVCSCKVTVLGTGSTGLATASKTVDCPHSWHEKPSRLEENMSAAYVELTPQDGMELEQILANIPVSGDRYAPSILKMVDK